MTPVDDRLKEMYHDYLADFGIESFSPPQILRSVTDAQKLSSGEVEDMTRNALVEYPDVDAIYFQGALLDPLPVLEKMENAFKLPVVASNPAMLWVILSRLGLRYSIQGYGRLLASWPAIPTGPF
jgi:maleate cis-trans isomerase